MINNYLAFTDRRKSINRKFNVSGYEIDLINLVARMQFSGQIIFVKNLIYHHEIAAQATLHSSLKRIISKKLLVTKAHKFDDRKKEVCLTQLDLSYFKQLDQALSK